MASSSEDLAIGSWTLVISCQVVAPVEREASSVVGATPRMPSATNLTATGAAYTTAATMAVKRVGPKRPSTGIR